MNRPGLEKYSGEFTDKVLNAFYASRYKIKGPEILELTEVAQLNYFILKSLFESWQNESANLRSPYFDYENEEVVNSMDQLMNALSRNISIGRSDFEPIMQKAVLDSLLIIFSPYDFFINEIKTSFKEQVAIEGIRQNEKYIKVNNHLYSALISKFEDKASDDTSSAEAVALLDEVFMEFKGTPDDFDPYLESFSKVIPLNLETIYGEEEQDELKDILNDKFQQSNTTVNDSLGSDEVSTVAESLQKDGLKTIGNSLSVNQRFMFVKELFQGDIEEFNKTIDFLDQCGDEADAIKYVNDNYARPNSWDFEKEEVAEFYELISLKFA